MATIASQRFAYIDWLRVVAIFLLHLFHTGMIFSPWTYHLKNEALLPQLELPLDALHVLRMPLLMVVAGAATSWALRKRSIGVFAWDRVKRLLFPLLFGCLVVVPPQIYIELITQTGGAHTELTYLGAIHRPGFQGSYLDFYPQVWAFQAFPKGSLSWHHLWFVAYLFVYSLLSLPLFAWLKRPAGEQFLANVDAWLSKGIRVLLLGLPLVWVQILFRHFNETLALLDDPKVLSYFFLLFLYGHLLARCPSLMDHLGSKRRTFLGITLILGLLLLFQAEFPFPLGHVLEFMFVWCGLLSAWSCARQHIGIRKPWLAYAQEVAYPFYILHQTVLLILAYGWLDLPLGPWPKMGSLFVLSFAATVAMCELIRRSSWLRPLFGMPPSPKTGGGLVV